MIRKFDHSLDSLSHDSLSSHPLTSVTDFAQADRAEYLAEVFEDADRPGYLNFGEDPTGRGEAVLEWVTDDTKVNGQQGNDIIWMLGTTNNTVHGGSGDDWLDGAYGNDTLYGDSGNDHLKGGNGADTLYGGSGNDLLEGGLGDDTLNGGSGNDVLIGGLGKDVMSGGSGADTFVFNSVSESPPTDFLGVFSHPDVVTDFQRGQDKIDLSQLLSQGFGQPTPHLTFSDHATYAAGTVWAGTGLDGQQHVYVNVDGGPPDMEIVVHTTDGLQLTASDFHL